MSSADETFWVLQDASGAKLYLSGWAHSSLFLRASLTSSGSNPQNISHARENKNCLGKQCNA